MYSVVTWEEWNVENLSVATLQNLHFSRETVTSCFFFVLFYKENLKSHFLHYQKHSLEMDNRPQSVAKKKL